MNVFLTGGTGFIGQTLVARIRRRGWPLKVLVRNAESEAARWIAQQGATLVSGDVTDRDGLSIKLAGSDVLIHNAGVYEFGVDRAATNRMDAVNVQGTDNVLGAAHAAGIPRAVYVSTAWALGPSGYPPAPSVAKDERSAHDGRFMTAYDRSKTKAHEVALRWREKGLPLITAMPNGVVGPNDHSIFGYYLRLVMLGGMPPMAWGADAVYCPVAVRALADGFCMAAERAPVGEDYHFGGASISVRDMFALWGHKTGCRTPRWYLPRGFMRSQVALMEPIQRALGIPAFMSRESVEVTRAHLDYSSAKAQRDLGWTQPDRESMWDPIIHRERELMAGRKGFINKLRHQPFVDVQD